MNISMKIKNKEELRIGKKIIYWVFNERKENDVSYKCKRTLTQRGRKYFCKAHVKKVDEVRLDEYFLLEQEKKPKNLN